MHLSPARWSLTTRFAAVSSLLAILAILGVGSLTWLKARDNLALQHEARLRQEAAVIAEHTGSIINSVATTMASVAGNSVLATALVDSAGKETYLLPFLAGFQMINGVPVKLAFTDFEAKIIGVNRRYQPPAEDLAWLLAAMEGKGPRAVIRETPEGPQFLAAEWVTYSRTSTPEGALLYTFPLSAVLSRPDMRIAYDGGPADGGTIERRGGEMVLAQPMTTPEALRHLGLHVELKAPTEGYAASLRQVTLAYGATSLVVAGLIFLVSHLAGRQLTADLRQLSGFARTVVAEGFGARRTAVSGTGEVAELARGMNIMLDELSRLYSELADRSREVLARERERLAYAQAIGHFGNFDYDPTSRALEWSDETFAIFGFEGPDAPGFDEVLARVPAEEQGGLLERLADPRPGDTIDHRLLLPDGTVRHLHTTIGDVERGPDGVPRRLTGIVQDVTAQRLAELGLAERTRELQRSNRELESFAYVASHDMRQPLRMITSYLQLIERELGDNASDSVKTFFGFVTGGAKRMDRLIHDLLEYSRTGRGGPPQGEVRLGEVVVDALFNLDLAVREAGARITVADQAPEVIGERGELVRLFQNLVGNALKYRDPARPPEVEIGWRRQGGEWLLWVADNGIGIAPEDHERAFTIFQRLVRSDEYEGTGIGLAVCAKIVEHHRGRIWIESEPGQGAKFLFTLPAKA